MRQISVLTGGTDHIVRLVNDALAHERLDRLDDNLLETSIGGSSCSVGDGVETRVLLDAHEQEGRAKPVQSRGDVGDGCEGEEGERRARRAMSLHQRTAKVDLRVNVLGEVLVEAALEHGLCSGRRVSSAMRRGGSN